MKTNLKKIFELLLVLIIFYGIYSVFDKASYFFNQKPNEFTVVIVSLLFSAGLLFLYSYIISSGAKHAIEETLNNLEKKVQEKDQELHNAFKIKKAVEDEAEKTIIQEGNIE